MGTLFPPLALGVEEKTLKIGLRPKLLTLGRLQARLVCPRLIATLKIEKDVLAIPDVIIYKRQTARTSLLMTICQLNLGV